MQSDDHYTQIGKKRTFLSTWTGKAVVGTASIAMVGGGYYYLQPSKASSPSLQPRLQTSFSAKKSFKDQTNLQEVGTDDADRRAAVCGAAQADEINPWTLVTPAVTDTVVSNSSSSHNITFVEGSVNVAITGPGSTRLVLDPNRDSRYMGWIEHNLDYDYQRVCGSRFSANDAKTTCRSLGLPTSGATTYTPAVGSSTAGNFTFNCTGQESDLPYCSIDNSGGVCQDSDAGVICGDSVIGNENYRLVVDPNAQYGSSIQGRVQVNVDGTWGNVCDDNFSDSAARVFCNSIGLPSDGAFAIQQYGVHHSGSNPFVMDDVSCSGTEATIQDCGHITSNNCGPAEQVGVSCGPGGGNGSQNKIITSADDRWRIVLDPSHADQYCDGGIARGRVEYNNGNEWGTVCDDYFDQNNNAAMVFCKSMGLPYTQASAYSGLWETGTGNILLDDVQCNGDEADITVCGHSTSHNCAHSEDVGVICEGEEVADEIDVRPAGDTNIYSSDNQFRLVVNPNTVTEYETGSQDKITKVQGRVEVYRDNQWGTVCDDSFSHSSAQVFCKSLDLPYSGAQTLQNLWAFGEDNILMDDVTCQGHEDNIFQCQHTTSHNCGHQEDVGVICVRDPSDNGSPKIIERNNYRLVLNDDAGNTTWTDDSFTQATRASGRVEVNRDGEWGTVCDDSWNAYPDNAKVFCKSLGLPYDDAYAIMVYGNNYAPGEGRIQMDDVSCQGSESELSECTFTTSHNCGHGEDVGVTCAGSLDSSTNNTTDANNTSDEVCAGCEGNNTTDGDRPVPDANGTITVGMFRLVRDAHSSYAYKGRAEIADGSRWGTICDDGFNDQAARVFCKSLGLPYDYAHEIPGYGRTVNSGEGEILMDDVSCTGAEDDLTQCTFSTTSNCGHTEDVGVVCI